MRFSIWHAVAMCLTAAVTCTAGCRGGSRQWGAAGEARESVVKKVRAYRPSSVKPVDLPAGEVYAAIGLFATTMGTVTPAETCLKSMLEVTA